MRGPVSTSDDPCVQVLRAVADIGDFFNLDRPDPAGLPLSQLIDSAELYHARIDATGRALGRLIDVNPADLPRRPIASLAFLGISARLVAPTLAAATLHQLVPEIILENVAGCELPDGRLVLRLTRFHALDQTPTRDVADQADLIGRHLIQGQIAKLVSAFATRDALHPRLLWGTVASTLASAAVLINQHCPDRADTTNKTARLILERGPLARCGRLTQDADGSHYQRHSCCLYYQFPKAGTCGDCPLPPQSPRSHEPKSARVSGLTSTTEAVQTADRRPQNVPTTLQPKL